MTTQKPRRPAKLGVAGGRLWSSMTEQFEFEVRELAILTLACRQADDVARLDELIDKSGIVVAGVKGQPRLASTVAEVRQGRLALARLLGELALPDANDKPRSFESQRASDAAKVRWDLEKQRRVRRG